MIWHILNVLGGMMKNKKQVILDVATDLFNREGYQAVGIDKVINVAGVSKLTLYRHFASKEKLIQTVLEQKKIDFLEELAATLHQQTSPKAQLQAFFSYYDGWFHSEAFRGCMFMNSVVEFNNRSQAFLEINRSIREELIMLLSKILCHWVKHERAKRIAYTLNMFIDGAIISEITWGRNNEYSPAHLAWSAAKTLLDAEGIEL